MPGHVLRRSQVAESAVRALVVVGVAVLQRQQLGLDQAREHLAVQELVPQRPVEALRIPVLPRAPGDVPNVVEIDLNGVASGC